ncbi:MAG: hypothetical protein GW946_02045 [Candidatus Pacebacteria bacterium]|nr:hypothetical protein [Candidatus Paceibacterota bacterium]PIR60215.1 MAG: hypothetical protein COU67_03060 [Candidatus Pacebacteria bacterium CG10_big_fil_rev_8_21_14_0_10_44_54]
MHEQASHNEHRKPIIKPITTGTGLPGIEVTDPLLGDTYSVRTFPTNYNCEYQINHARDALLTIFSKIHNYPEFVESIVVLGCAFGLEVGACLHAFENAKIAAVDYFDYLLPRFRTNERVNFIQSLFSDFLENHLPANTPDLIVLYNTDATLSHEDLNRLHAFMDRGTKLFIGGDTWLGDPTLNNKLEESRAFLALFEVAHTVPRRTFFHPGTVYKKKVKETSTNAFSPS